MALRFMILRSDIDTVKPKLAKKTAIARGQQHSPAAAKAVGLKKHNEQSRWQFGLMKTILPILSLRSNLCDLWRRACSPISDHRCPFR